MQEELASNTVPTAFDSQVIDLLDPKFDFFDGLDSQQQSMIRTSNIIEINERGSSQNGDDNVSLESSDTVIQKLLEFKKSKRDPKKPKKETIPFYLKDTLPGKEFQPAKQLAESMPESVERPSAEKVSNILTQLYKIERAKK